MTEVLRQCKSRRQGHRCRHTNDDGHARHVCEQDCCSWYDYSGSRLRCRESEEGAVELYLAET